MSEIGRSCDSLNSTCKLVHNFHLHFTVTFYCLHLIWYLNNICNVVVDWLVWGVRRWTNVCLQCCCAGGRFIYYRYFKYFL